MTDTALDAPVDDVLDAFSSEPPRAAAAPAAPAALFMPGGPNPGAQAVAVPRDEVKIIARIKALAAVALGDWYYRFPVKTKDGGTDYIEGPSIKLANALITIYGNCNVDTSVADLGDRWKIGARFIDIEAGSSQIRPYDQPKRIRSRDESRTVDVAYATGVSKAIRNVVVNALGLYADLAFREAKRANIAAIAAELAERKAGLLARLAEMKIGIRRVELAVGGRATKWRAEEVAKGVAILQAIEDGMATVDESFPPLPPRPPKAEPKPDEVAAFAAGKPKRSGRVPAAEAGETAPETAA